MQRAKELNLSINHHEVMACMRSSALAVSFLLQLQLGVGSRSCTHEAAGQCRESREGRCQWRPTKSASARESRTAFTAPVRP